ncbi:MAG TPA: hypothetical protein VM008_18935 [Phycisphaerae bacterium]|nr:hypothetical protein [Phycisphaerae bacterium]
MLLLAGLLIPALALPGCNLLGFQEEVQGHPVEAQYKGLADKSVAIVIYADQATTNEFPAAREELSAFISTKFRENLSTTKLLDYHEVMNWQDDTINWFGLTEKQIGKHFGVDRVLYIEVLDYSVHQKGGVGDLQGHLRANCKVYEIDTPGNDPAWSTLLDVSFPEDHAADPSQVPPDAVRSRTLDKFSEALLNCLYDHHEIHHAVDE